jgi:hypothetical protein
MVKILSGRFNKDVICRYGTSLETFCAAYYKAAKFANDMPSCPQLFEGSLAGG